MRLRNIIQSISRKILFIILGIIIVVAALYTFWQYNKYGIVKNKVKITVAEQTDSLYIVKYDSLHFDELKGEAYLKNVHIAPDTAVIKNKILE